MTEVTLDGPRAEHAAELGRICHDAFLDISTKHGFPPDFPNVEYAQMVVGSLIASETAHAVAAFVDGRPAGSNFLVQRDEVGAVGPITVDPKCQGLGIGRQLMQDVLQHASDMGTEKVRLVQDAFNVVSMSLYGSLGFDTKAPLGLLDLCPAEGPSDHVRPIEAGDVDACENLSREIYKVSRRNEIARPMMPGLTAVVSERGGRVRGYLVPGLIGHGVAETEDDMLAMLRAAARLAPFPITQLLPLTEGSLFRKALAEGHTLRKMMNLMAIGPYEEPDGVWVPSVGY